MTDDSGFADAIKLSDMSVSGSVGRTWRYYTGSPNYAFGHGLSCESLAVTHAPHRKRDQSKFE
jgi:hypothetical protein